MRIVHVSLRYPPATGGVENYVRDAVEGTRRRGFDSRVLTTRLRTHHPAAPLDPNLLLDDPPYVQRLHHFSTPYLAYPRLQALPHYLAHHQPDIIEAYSFWYHPADAAARYAAKYHLPFIFHPMFYNNENRQKWQWRLYRRFIGQGTFAAANATVVISPHEQELIVKAGFPVHRFHLIPPGIDISRFARNRLNPYLKQGITGRILLSVSRLAPGKGLDELIKCLPAIKNKIPDIRLVIVGEDFGYRAALNSVVNKYQVADLVHFAGRVPDDKLPAYYQHADLLLHPTHYEAFGIVLAESQAAGTPVIARHVAAVPFVAPHETGGLLFKDPEQLVAFTVKALSDPKLYEYLSRHGQKYVADNFNHESQMQKITALYTELSPG